MSSVVSLLVLLISFTLFYVVKSLFFSTFSKFPGPRIGKITSLWAAWKGYNNETNQYIHSLHCRYGPVVLVTPSLICFNKTHAINPIYNAKTNLSKPDTASKMDNYGHPNSFSSISGADHKRRRSRYASCYSKSRIVQGPGYSAISSRLSSVLLIIGQAAEAGRSVDIYELLHGYAIEIASIFTIGISPNLLGGKDLSYSINLRCMFAGLAYMYWFDVVNVFLKHSPRVLHFMVPKALYNAMKAYTAVEKYNMDQFNQAMMSTIRSEYEESVLLRLLRHSDFLSDDLTAMHVASETGDHLLAGADTLVAGLVYTLWELARPQNAQRLERLKSDLKGIDFDETGLPKQYPDVDKLPYLDACIREGLRLHAPSGHIQSRMSPPGGLHIGDYFIPEKTEIGISIYAIMLNPDIYQDPVAFWPERWLPTTSSQQSLIEMRKGWMAFGHGARHCIGKELALVEMKLLLACLLQDMMLVLDPKQDQGEMEGIQAAVLAPRGGRCLLSFSAQHDRM